MPTQDSVQQNKTVVVTLRKSTKGLQVTIDPWEVEVRDGDDLEWILKDRDGLAPRGLEVNDTGKKVSNTPDFPNKKPGVTTIVHGPFKKASPTQLLHYNIILKTSTRDIRIDPDYKVTP